jgi:hypothetical protein
MRKISLCLLLYLIQRSAFPQVPRTVIYQFQTYYNLPSELKKGQRCLFKPFKQKMTISVLFDQLFGGQLSADSRFEIVISNISAGIKSDYPNFFATSGFCPGQYFQLLLTSFPLKVCIPLAVISNM